MRSPGRLTAIPSAIVSTDGAGTGSPRRSDSGYGAQAATWTPITSTSGRAALTAIAMPEQSPPPPTGTTTRARSGTSSSSSSPSDPWPATMSGSSNGCTKASPPLARSLVRERQAVVDRAAADVDDRALAARGLDLGQRRVVGHEDLARHAAGAGGGGEALGVVAGRRGDHAGGAAAVAEGGELGRRAAQLERARALQVLGLERDHAAGALGDRPRREHRGAAGDRVDRGARRRDVGGAHPAARIRGHQAKDATDDQRSGWPGGPPARGVAAA